VAGAMKLLYGNIMVVSVQLADDGPLAALRARRATPRPSAVAGLRDARAVTLAPLGPRLLPSPRPGRFGLVCAWEDEAACAAWLARDGGPFAGGYGVALRPTRVVGAWPPFGPLGVEGGGGADEAAPVAVMTLGRLRLRRALPFLRAGAAAEGDAVADPALLLATGMAHPPRFVGTFSLWRDGPSMRAYVERAGGGHRGATAAHGADPFHHAAAFVRFAPYAQTGRWAPGTA